MSTVLHDLRAELVNALDDLGVTLYDHVPARAHLPAAFLVPGSPYIEQGVTFGARRVRFGVVLLTATQLNDHETAELDQFIENAHNALAADGWTVERVDTPQIQDLNGSEILATTLRVATDASFN